MRQLLLDELVFKPGQDTKKEDTIIIPLLETLKIPHAISIGPMALNMAEAFETSLPALYEREEAFLAKNELLSLENAIISGVPQPDQPKITTVTPGDARQKKTGTKIQTECLFTTSPNVLLIHKPADCPTAIIKAAGKDDKNILGLVHLGRPQVNERIAEQVLTYLFKNYDCNPKDIFIGITPSIGPKYYWIKKSDQALIDRNYWNDFVSDDVINDEKIIRVDVLGKILAILAEYKIPHGNIQAYGHADEVDTFQLASLNPPQAFSSRFATSTNQPERNGRIMVAAQLLDA